MVSLIDYKWNRIVSFSRATITKQSDKNEMFSQRLQSLDCIWIAEVSRHPNVDYGVVCCEMIALFANNARRSNKFVNECQGVHGKKTAFELQETKLLVF